MLCSVRWERRSTDDSLDLGVGDGDLADDGVEVARRVGDLRDSGDDDRGILGDDAERAEHEGADGGEDVEELHGCEMRQGEKTNRRAGIRAGSNGEGHWYSRRFIYRALPCTTRCVREALERCQRIAR